MNSERIATRFAPSPTGLLHSGNYRTAIFAYLFAKKLPGGKFIVRIEDTDTERSRKEFEDNIFETLSWLSLKPDEIYRQHEHQGRHRELLERLIKEDKAYLSKEEVTEKHTRSEVIRFRNPNRQITFTDTIRGPITINTTDLGDFVIARNMSEPVYHFAVVVDDADEEVTHVIRGEEHISNTPRQILIQHALGFTTPIYSHLPLVLNSDHTKLSKRQGAKALTQYRDEGYLPEAVLNYLALLGWHPEDNQEIFSLPELVEKFNLSRIQKSSGIFDETKLLWYNQEYLKRLPDKEFGARLKAYIKNRKESVPVYFSKVLPLLKERSQTLKEATELLSREFDFFAGISIDKNLLLKGARAEEKVVKGHLEKVHSLLSEIPQKKFQVGTIKDTIFPYADKEGRGVVLWPLRVALSGKEKSPDPFTLAFWLGKEETLGRIVTAQGVL